MSNQSESVAQERMAASDGDQLETAGQAILKLLHKAADATEGNRRQALATAQKLASQLRAAEDRIAQLEARFNTTVRSLTARKRGSAKFPRRLRIA